MRPFSFLVRCFNGTTRIETVMSFKLEIAKRIVRKDPMVDTIAYLGS